jgi:elongation factor G
VMSDLSARRGRLLGNDEAGAERVSVRAVVPCAELVRYAVDLRAMTHGAGTFTRTFASYDVMPDDLARGVEHR